MTEHPHELWTLCLHTYFLSHSLAAHCWSVSLGLLLLVGGWVLQGSWAKLGGVRGFWLSVVPAPPFYHTGLHAEFPMVWCRKAGDGGVEKEYREWLLPTVQWWDRSWRNPLWLILSRLFEESLPVTWRLMEPWKHTKCSISNGMPRTAKGSRYLIGANKNYYQPDAEWAQLVTEDPTV